MPLFTEPSTPRARPIGWIEPAVHFLTQSTRAEAREARQVLNEWYESFPDPDKVFARRLRSEVDIEHYQALDELWTFTLLVHRFNDVRYEEGGVGPDFRLYESSRCIAAIEVLSLFQREDWTLEEKRHARLADAVDHVMRPSAGYFVHFSIERADRDPAPARFIEFLRRQIDQLPAHDLLIESLSETAARPALPTATYQSDGVRISVRFMPMSADAPSKSDPDARIVDTGPITGGIVNSGERLRKKVAAKGGGRYEISDVPFMVMVGVHDMFCSDDQVVGGLYGGETVNFPSGDAGRRNTGSLVSTSRIGKAGINVSPPSQLSMDVGGKWKMRDFRSYTTLTRLTHGLISSFQLLERLAQLRPRETS